MDVAIIGLPMSGKTTVFNALTHGNADTTGGSGTASEMHVGVVKVPDPRLDVLTDMYHPKKTIPAEIKYWDFPGVDAETRSQGLSGRHRNILQGADAFLLVVRAFTNPSVPHALGGINPAGHFYCLLAFVQAFFIVEVVDIDYCPIGQRSHLHSGIFLALSDGQCALEGHHGAFAVSASWNPMSRTWLERSRPAS